MVMMMEFAAGIFFRGKNFLNFYLAAALYVWVIKWLFFNHKIVLYVANQSRRKFVLPNRIKIPFLTTSLIPACVCESR